MCRYKYDIDTVPTSPFNHNISAIDNLIQYQNKYIGDNSNTGQLIGALPLSEYDFNVNSYSITREAIEKNYPNYNDIFVDNAIDIENYNQYVEQKMNDRIFVSNIFKLFKKE